MTKLTDLELLEAYAAYTSATVQMYKLHGAFPLANVMTLADFEEFYYMMQVYENEIVSTIKDMYEEQGVDYEKADKVVRDIMNGLK
jgi:hypothetical protein